MSYKSNSDYMYNEACPGCNLVLDCECDLNSLPQELRQIPKCTSHHNACACREWHVRLLELENEALRAEISSLKSNVCKSCGGTGIKRDPVLLRETKCGECSREVREEQIHFSYLP